MPPSSFQVWFDMINVVEEYNPFSYVIPTFWDRPELKQKIRYLVEEYTSAQLHHTWITDVVPKLNKLIFDPERRKKFQLKGENPILRSWRKKLGDTQVDARERTREKLLKKDEQVDDDSTFSGHPAQQSESGTRMVKAGPSVLTEFKGKNNGKSHLNSPIYNPFGVTNPCLFKTHVGEKMRFFCFRDKCYPDKNTVADIRQLGDIIELNGGKVLKRYGDIENEQHVIMLVFDKKVWHPGCVRELCESTGIDLFSVDFIYEAIHCGSLPSLDKHRIHSGYLCNEYDANMVINQKLSWDDIDKMVALKGHGEGCRGVSNGYRRYRNSSEGVPVSELKGHEKRSPERGTLLACESAMLTTGERKILAICKTSTIAGQSVAEASTNSSGGEPWAESAELEKERKIKLVLPVNLKLKGMTVQEEKRPKYEQIHDRIVTAVAVVRKNIGKNPTTDADWTLVCTEIRKMWDINFSKQVQRGHIPDELGIDFDNLEKYHSTIRKRFYRNILPNAARYKKLMVSLKEPSNFLTTWRDKLGEKDE